MALCWRGVSGERLRNSLHSDGQVAPRATRKSSLVGVRGEGEQPGSSPEGYKELVITPHQFVTLPGLQESTACNTNCTVLLFALDGRMAAASRLRLHSRCGWLPPHPASHASTANPPVLCPIASADGRPDPRTPFSERRGVSSPAWVESTAKALADV